MLNRPSWKPLDSQLIRSPGAWHKRIVHSCQPSMQASNSATFFAPKKKCRQHPNVSKRNVAAASAALAEEIFAGHEALSYFELAETLKELDPDMMLHLGLKPNHASTLTEFTILSVFFISTRSPSDIWRPFFVTKASTFVPLQSLCWSRRSNWYSPS